MFPIFKLLAPGYGRRMARFRKPGELDLLALWTVGAPREVHLGPEAPWAGCRAEAVSFPSPFQTRCAENNRVWGRLLTRQRGAPWVVIVPGLGAGALRRSSYDVFQSIHGRTALSAGLNVALIDLPYHKQRRRPGCTSGEGFFSPDLDETAGVFRQAAADVIALIRYLQQERGAKVGLWGTSLGGAVAGLVSAFMPSLAASVLMEPLDNPGHPLLYLRSTQDIVAHVKAAGFSPEEIPQLLQGVAPSSYRPALDRERILFITTLWDRIVKQEHQEHFWKAWGCPPRVTWEGGHVTSAYNQRLVGEAVSFLTGKLLTEEDPGQR
jgi:dienelactone hydrolase